MDMEKLFGDMTNLLSFLASFMLIYTPCLIGSLCGMRFNQLKEEKDKNSKSKKKGSIRRTIAMALSSSILPSLVILISEFLLPSVASMHYIMKYGIAMLLGFMGTEKLTVFLANIPTILRIMSAVSKGKNGIPELEKIFEELEKKDKPTDEQSDDKKD